MKAENIAHFTCSVKFDRTNLCGLNVLFSALSPRAYAIFAAILTLLIIAVIIGRITLRCHSRNSCNHKQHGQQPNTDFLLHLQSSPLFASMCICSSLSCQIFHPQMQGFLRTNLNALTAHNALRGMCLRHWVDIHWADLLAATTGHTAFFIPMQHADTDGIQQAVNCPQRTKHFAKEAADKQAADEHRSQYHSF